MTKKLGKNEVKVLNILSKKKEMEQSKILEKFDGNYSSRNSKKVCLSNALTNLEKMEYIKSEDKDNPTRGIPEKIWKLIKL